MQPQPTILAIETSTDACSVALSYAGQSFSKIAVEPQAHAKLLLGMVDTVLQQAGIKLQTVDAFAYGQGPGSFTGLRIATSVVQGLAFGVGKPLLAVSSLQALAQQAFNQVGALHSLAVLDARMQEIYWGAYCANQQGLVEVVIVDQLQKPATLVLPEHEKYLAVGTGAQAYTLPLSHNNPGLTFNTQILYPRAAEILQLALAQYAGGNLLTPSQAIPVYLRDNVVQTGKKNPD
mgnify:FL=1